MGEFTQALRLARLDTPLGEDVLLLVRFEGEESISQPFRFQLDLQSEKRDINPADILRQPANVSWVMRDGSVRHLNGFISRFSQGASDAQLTNYRAELVPWTHFLSLRRDCRIFQNLSVPDIVAEVFTGAGFNDFDIRCASRPTREYCVQYAESDLNFVQRMLEEEGIYYFFEHEQDKHTLVLADEISQTPDCPPPSTVPVLAVSAPEEDVVTTFEWENSINIGSVMYRDYDHLQPSFTLDGLAPGQEGEEVYEYWPGRYTTRAEGERLARYRLEAEEALREQAHGRSECRNLIAGHKFTLTEHTNSRANQQYLLTAVRHICDNGEYRSEESGAAFDYSNEFTCLPASVPFRPRRMTRKPLIHGSQTAVVVGPPGEEIYTDEHGRVKLHFHWDRLGQRDENSSCWVRVSHSWAGQGWGAVFIPRIGQEVIVDFLEGDPNQPIVTGRIYNGEQVPPYELPQHMTQSGIKSRSSKGGGTGDFNEIRMEDLKGKELLYIHAQRDQQQVTERNRTESVGVDRQLSVGRDKSEKVGRDTSTTVGRNRQEMVGVDETGMIGGNRSWNIVGSDSLVVGTTRAETVAGASAETVGGAKALTIGGAYQVSVGAVMNATVVGAMTEEIGAYRMIKVVNKLTADAESVDIKGKDKLELSSGAAKISMTSDGKIEISGTHIKLSAGAGTVEIDPGGIITIKGPMVKINT